MTANRKSQFSTGLGLILPTMLAMAIVNGCHRPRPPMTAAEEQQEFVDSLTRSGPVPPVLESILQRKVGDLWDVTFEIGVSQLTLHGRSKDDLRSAGNIRCFKNGCMSDLLFTDQAAATIFEAGLLVGPASPLRHWPGRIYRGPFLQVEGGVKATWGLLVDANQYKALISLPTGRHATIVPTVSRPTTASSDQ